MGKNKTLHCCDCDAYHRLTPFDNTPTYSVVGDAVHAVERDDAKRFRDAHSGHCCELLQVTAPIKLY